MRRLDGLEDALTRAGEMRLGALWDGKGVVVRGADWEEAQAAAAAGDEEEFDSDEEEDEIDWEDMTIGFAQLLEWARAKRTELAEEELWLVFTAMTTRQLQAHAAATGEGDEDVAPLSLIHI